VLGSPGVLLTPLFIQVPFNFFVSFLYAVLFFFPEGDSPDCGLRATGRNLHCPSSPASVMWNFALSHPMRFEIPHINSFFSPLPYSLRTFSKYFSTPVTLQTATLPISGDVAKTPVSIVLVFFA